MPGRELNATSQKQTSAAVVYSGLQHHLFREIIQSKQSHVPTSKNSTNNYTTRPAHLPREVLIPLSLDECHAEVLLMTNKKTAKIATTTFKMSAV
jgi:hypothetical protein